MAIKVRVRGHADARVVEDRPGEWSVQVYGIPVGQVWMDGPGDYRWATKRTPCGDDEVEYELEGAVDALVRRWWRERVEAS